ncbi:MAG: Rrf2 family transcriptional regulator [Fibrobacter sp.]|jgi:Rrf2 family protein|nr:Rrf2 family transcriptional regulator [Fibrobacter sp.]
MKLITRKTDYAVSSLCYIASKKYPVSVTELCGELDMPYAFLRGILQQLQLGGILVSLKGKNGGFQLTRRPEDISLYDIMSIFGDGLENNECVFKKLPCKKQKVCPLRKNLDRIKRTIKKEFETVNLKSLMVISKE